jgi:hypothetical protein
MRSDRDPGKHVGEPSARIDVIEPAVIMSEYIAAARWPPRSNPANSDGPTGSRHAVVEPFLPGWCAVAVAAGQCGSSTAHSRAMRTVTTAVAMTVMLAAGSALA